MLHIRMRIHDLELPTNIRTRNGRGAKIRKMKANHKRVSLSSISGFGLSPMVGYVTAEEFHTMGWSVSSNLKPATSTDTTTSASAGQSHANNQLMDDVLISSSENLKPLKQGHVSTTGTS